MFIIPEARTIGNAEFPLSIQLQYGPHSNALELRLVQKHNKSSKGGNNVQRESDSEEENDFEDNRDIVTPKDEGLYCCSNN